MIIKKMINAFCVLFHSIKSIADIIAEYVRKVVVEIVATQLSTNKGNFFYLL